MTEQTPIGTYTVRAVHPKKDLPSIVEACPTSLAAEIRAGQLYLAGYNVEVIQALPNKDD